MVDVTLAQCNRLSASPSCPLSCPTTARCLCTGDGCLRWPQAAHSPAASRTSRRACCMPPYMPPSTPAPRPPTPQVGGHPAHRAAPQPAPAAAGGPGSAGAAAPEGRSVRAGGGQQVGGWGAVCATDVAVQMPGGLTVAADIILQLPAAACFCTCCCCQQAGAA
jgi:hypothetical protein